MVNTQGLPRIVPPYFSFGCMSVNGILPDVMEMAAKPAPETSRDGHHGDACALLCLQQHRVRLNNSTRDRKPGADDRP